MSEEDARAVIESSGNTFHARVARFFRERGWTVSVSPYYMDQSQGKAREIDLVAERKTDIPDSFGRWQGDVVTRLFVECKYVPSGATSVFWFAPKDINRALDRVLETEPFHDNRPEVRGHHYLTTQEVAKVFASRGKSGQEQEPFYKALNQVLNATTVMREKGTQIAQVAKSKGTIVILDYPVVMCSSFEGIWRTSFFAEGNIRPQTENFQLEVDYAYTNPRGEYKDEYMLLDVVDLNQADEFLRAIQTDADIAAYSASQ